MLSSSFILHPSSFKMPPMATVLLTGFPGFLASKFVPNLLARLDSETSVTCLVQSQYRPLAEGRAAEIAGQDASWKDRIHIVQGDITRPGLALADSGHALEPETREAYHFAAVYDLAVPRPLGMKVNVEGTVNLLDFLEGCSRFERLHYVSTCYVSGRHPGRFSEKDLSLGQRFNNYYEETKYLAEVEVQKRMARGLAATIYRPSIVVGDSRTGETQKFDGPYGALRWIQRFRSTALMVSIGDPRRYHVNLAPRDFVIAALTRLSAMEASRGQVYQLCDPNPPTVEELTGIMSAATGRKVKSIPMAAWLMKSYLRYVPGAVEYSHITPESIDYFTHPTDYTCENTLRDLSGSGISCPSFRDYAATVVRFMNEHPEIGAYGMY
jgi:nucleoside-diphosphate-sugar epimerase